MIHKYTGVVLAGLLMFPCCASTGRKVKSSRVAQIVDGTTTRAQVLKMFGKPCGYAPEGGELLLIYPIARTPPWVITPWSTYAINARKLGKTGLAEEWFWSYASKKLWQSDSFGQYLGITLDAKGIVQSHKFNEVIVPSD